MNLSFEEKEYVRHQGLYYSGHPEISDPEFDALEDYIKETYPNSIVLKKVGTFKTNTDDKFLIKHNKEMLSLNKTREVADIYSWARGEKLFVSIKEDGTASSLIYNSENDFELAKTRHDGTYGKNITNNFSFLNIPRHIVYPKNNIEIRGETVITEANFAKLTKECIKRQIKKPESIRNVVAGLLNPGKKHNVDLAKYLNFVAYEIVGIDIETEVEVFNLLRYWGFETPVSSLVTESIECVTSLYANQKDGLDYLSDGLVFAINNRKKQIARGSTGHHFKGKMAFKLVSETGITTALEIIQKTNRSGKTSFVAEIEPIFLSGATLTRVTLHNASQIKLHQLAVGDKIEITRSGEVIPKLLRVVEHNGKYKLPTHCNSCGSKLEWSETGTDLMCNNINCDSKNITKIIHWIKAVDIEEIGEKTVQRLFDEDLIGSILDLYKLKKGDISGLSGFGNRKEEIIIGNINKSKTITINKVIIGMGFTGIGKTFTKELTKVYPNLEAMKQVTVRSLLKIAGIGDVTANDFVTYFPQIEEMYSSLVELGFNIIEGERQEIVSANIEGLKFVITGKLSEGRDAIKQLIIKNGGKVSGSISKSTDYLVAGEKAGTKLSKAKANNVTILTEAELLDMIK